MSTNSRGLKWLFLAWGASVLATLGSLYMSEILHYIPCDLCWIQRIFMYPMALLLGMAYAREDKSIALYALPFACIGSLFSIYHILMQKFPDTIGSSGSCGIVPCTGDYLNWFGFITTPMLALTAFIIIIISLIQVLRSR